MRNKVMDVIAHAKSVLEYDAETGQFTRDGKPAGSVKNTGYLNIGVKGRVVLAHRLAWAWVYGEEPPKCLDHIDRNKLNNAISNLRDVGHSGNNVNREQRNNSTGVAGVTFKRPAPRVVGPSNNYYWIAYDDAQSTLYCGKDWLEACAARKSWEAEYWRAA